MFSCASRTSDSVFETSIDCVRADRETSLSLRKRKGLLVLFSLGTRRSEVQLHKSEKTYIRDITTLSIKDYKTSV